MRVEETALLLVDPYNDFLSEGGKVWPALEEVAVDVGLLDNLRAVVAAAKDAGVRIFIVPHRRWEPGDYESWEFPTPSQVAVGTKHTFARGTWGGDWHPDFAPRTEDVVVKEHWASSGFANTDLDLQLRQHGIRRVLVVGVIANTCIESTSRAAVELGYHVTLVRDASAAQTREMMRATFELSGPTFAHAIVTTKELVAALRPSSAPAAGAPAVH